MTSRWASDTVLPLINHVMASLPNSEIGGYSPIELKFGTVHKNYFKLPTTLPPGHSYSAFVSSLNDDLTRLLLRQAVTLVISHLKGSKQMSFLSGYKTYIVAAAMLLTGVAGLLGVDIPNFTGQAPGNLVMEALAFLFLRQGLKSNG